MSGYRRRSPERRLLYGLLGLVLGCLLLVAQAIGAQEAQVVRIDPQIEDDQLVLSADIDFTLSGELHEAAMRGVSLYFTADLTLVRPRWWWFDQTVLSTNQTWRIQYNALTRQWRIGTGDLSMPATTLDEALDLVRHIRGWTLLPAAALEEDTPYQGRLRLRLDTSRLARPFQVDALNSKAWSLTTPWKDFTFSTAATRPD